METPELSEPHHIKQLRARVELHNSRYDYTPRIERRQPDNFFQGAVGFLLFMGFIAGLVIAYVIWIGLQV